jgi:hypothetical protein
MRYDAGSPHGISLLSMASTLTNGWNVQRLELDDAAMGNKAPMLWELR